MKLESFEMRFALASSDWHKATTILARYFSINIKHVPRVMFYDSGHEDASIAVSVNGNSYYWNSNRGFGKDGYSWLVGHQIHISNKWRDANT